MSLRDLPPEMHRTIRTYGYNPYVSDEDLYKMIVNLGYSYSLMSIYDRLVKWKCDLGLFKTKYQFNDYIAGKNVTSVTKNMIYPSRNAGKFRDIMTYLVTLQSNPVNPTEVFNEDGLLKYYHFSHRSRPSIPDYDGELVALIKDIYPSFSLQIEYDNLVMRSKYSDELNTEYAKFLLSVDEDLLQVEMSDNIIKLVFDDDLPDVPDFLDEVFIEHDSTEDRIGYMFKEGSETLFYQIVAFLSPRLGLTTEKDTKYPSHKLPFQSKPDF